MVMQSLSFFKWQHGDGARYFYLMTISISNCTVQCDICVLTAAASSAVGITTGRFRLLVCYFGAPGSQPLARPDPAITHARSGQRVLSAPSPALSEYHYTALELITVRSWDRALVQLKASFTSQLLPPNSSLID
jgi:hypothetical protein